VLAKDPSAWQPTTPVVKAHENASLGIPHAFHPTIGRVFSRSRAGSVRESGRASGRYHRDHYDIDGQYVDYDHSPVDNDPVDAGLKPEVEYVEGCG
jgi:hypothetical protein